MNKEIIPFPDTEIEKHNFCYSKYPFNMNIVDIHKMIMSKQVTFGKTGL